MEGPAEAPAAFNLSGLPLDILGIVGKNLVDRGDRKAAVTLALVNKTFLAVVTAALYRLVVWKKRAGTEDAAKYATFLRSKRSHYVLIFVFLCPPALFDSENRQQMILDLRLKAQRIVAVMWWDMRRENRGLVTADPVIYLTANYDTHGPNFGQMAQGAALLSSGEGAHRRVWGMRNRVFVRVEQRQNARPADDPRPVVLPTTGAGFYWVTVMPATRSSNAFVPLDIVRQISRSMARITWSETRRSELSLIGWRGWEADKGEGATHVLQALCRERALASNIIINYRKRHRDSVPSFDNGRSFAQSCQPVFDQATRAYNEDEVAPTLSINIDQGRNRFLDVAMEREPTGAVLARMVRKEGRAQPERESEIRFAAVEPEEW